MGHADIYRPLTTNMIKFETEMQILALKMPHTDSEKVRKCVVVEKKVTVMAVADAIGWCCFSFTAEKWWFTDLNLGPLTCFWTNNFGLLAWLQ